MTGDDRVYVELPRLSAIPRFLDRGSDQVHVSLRMHEKGIRGIERICLNGPDLVMEVGHRRSHCLGDRTQSPLVLGVPPTRVMQAAIWMTVELNQVHRVSVRMLNGTVRRSSFVPSQQAHAGRERTIYGHDLSRSRTGIALTAILSLTMAGCDVAWGGASLSLENPAPEPVVTDDGAGAVEAVVEPLPDGDLLYLVRFVAQTGDVEVAAAASFRDGLPEAMILPGVIDQSYRTRFDSTFYAAGTELALHAGGHRVGTLILDGSTGVPDTGCLSSATGRALLIPGTSVPEFAFAWTSGTPGGVAGAFNSPEADDRMRTFGPVLAENLLRSGGENRPYLAQRAEMAGVEWAGDERPAMTATYLVNDDLTRDPPSNAASSLFVLARFDRTRGYVSSWSEVRRYGNGQDREAFTYLGAITGPAGRVDFVTRHTGSAVSLAASLDGEDREIDWMEQGACSALDLVGALP
jgi:hypothetical protein